MLQSLIQTLYPPQCAMCEARTERDFALCGSCWADAPFIDGMCCDACGVPLPGQGQPSPDVLCDDCMTIARPWSKGRAAMRYHGSARKFVLQLKHGDRTDLAVAAGPWLARAGRDLLSEDSIILPVPLHRFRLLRRRFNQAALLAEQLSRKTGHVHIPDGLLRVRQTASLGGRTRDERFAELAQTMKINPRHHAQIEGKPVLIVDDVMTSGATFAAATEACFQAGADDVCVLALARVTKDA